MIEDALIAELKSSGGRLTEELADGDWQEIIDEVRKASSPNKNCFPVVKRDRGGNIITVFAVCSTLEGAEACAANANQWYGADHPLTPLVALNDKTCFFDPRPFPKAPTDD